MDNDSRRNFLRLGIIGLGSAFLLDSCAGNQPAGSQNGATPASAPAGNGDDEDESNPPDEKEVTAVEDLMREHGVLRRALLIYAEGALLLRKDPASLPPDALQKTAKIFRSFGEDYHEKQLEETYLFPLIKTKKQGSRSRQVS
jgi:hypothetical protein